MTEYHPVTNLAFYILADYKKGERIRTADFTNDGYNPKAIYKMFQKLKQRGFVKKLCQGYWQFLKTGKL